MVVEATQTPFAFAVDHCRCGCGQILIVVTSLDGSALDTADLAVILRGVADGMESGEMQPSAARAH